MANHSLVITIGANVQGLQNGLRTASTATRNWANGTLDAVERNEAAINGLSNKLGVMGAAGVAAAGLAVKKFADFDQAMSNVAATGEEAKLWMDELRDAAMEAGARTVYSATEAAGAIEELSKAGLSATDILGGGLDGALDLAAAGALSVADAASYTSVALNQFKLDGGAASHVADLLAAGAGKAMGDVSDLGGALKQGGLVAAQTGLSIEETTGALASFAAAGLLGSDAGTSLKTMLQRLTPSSDEAQKQFDKLGVSAYDAQGQFVGLENFAGQLRDSMKDMTPEARNAAMAVMFGSDAVRAASVLYDEGAAGIKGWISAVDDQGYAAEVAATRLDNLKGDIEGLGGAFDTWMINLGEGANGPLRAMVQSATDVVNAFSDLPSGVQNATLAIVGVGGLAALGLAGVGKVLIMVKDTRNALTAMSISAKTAGIAIGGVGAALGIATIVMMSWADAQADARAQVEALKDSLDEQTGAITVQSVQALADAAEKVKKVGWITLDSSVADQAKIIGLSVSDLTDAILDNGDAAERVGAATNAYKGDITAIGEAADLAGVDITDYGAAQMNVNKFIDDQRGKLGDAKEKWASTKEAVESATGAQEKAGAATDETRSAIQKYAAAQSVGTEKTEGYTDALKELVDAQRAASGVVLSERDARRQYEQALDDATKALRESAGVTDEMYDKQGKLTNQGRALVEQYVKSGKALDITTEAGRRNQDALDGIVDKGESVIESMRANGASQEELQKAVQKTRDDFISQAEKMGLSKKAAKALADEMKLFPKDISVEVAVDTANAKAELDAWIRQMSSGKRIAIGVGGKPVASQADGGPVYGPGTSTSDSIPTMLSNGEYVIKASSVRKYGTGLLGMLNAGHIPAFAQGGIVGVSEVQGHSLAYWEERRASALEVVQMRQRVRDLKASLKETEKYGKGGKKTRQVLRGLDRREAELELKGAERELSDALTANRLNKSKQGTIASRIKAEEKSARQAEKAEEKAKEKANSEREAAKKASQSETERGNRVADARREASTDARRGTTRDAVTGGLSSALGVVDDVLSMARNPDLSKGTRNKLAEAAKDAEKQLTKLYAKADGIKSKLEGATATMNELASIKASTASALAGAFSLGDSFKEAAAAQQQMHQDAKGNVWYTQGAATAGGFTGKGMLSDAQGYASKLKTFAGKLQKVAAVLGPKSGVIMQEIAGLGVEKGSAAADAILSMSKTDQAAYVQAYADIDTQSQLAGEYVTQGFYKGGLASATKEVDELNTSLQETNDKIAGIGKTLEATILGSLGLKLNGKGQVVKKALGGWIRGAGTGTSDSIHAMLSNGEYVVSSAAAAKYGAVLEAINADRGAGRMQLAPAPSTGAGAARVVVDVAQVLDGRPITLMIEGKPFTAIVQSQLGATSTQARYAKTGV